MADISIQYAVSPTACAGGGHFDLTATIKGLGADIVVPLHVPHLSEQRSSQEAKAALEVITWSLVKKYLTGSTHSEVLALLGNKQIVLDPQAI